MSVFSKIFGSTKQKVAGDEGRILVPVYLESIAAGANPKTQVEKIKAIVGDSNPEFNGFLDELAAINGDEKPEVVGKAVEIVTKFYKENMAGDEKEVVVKKDGNDKNVEVKKDGKETKDIEVKKDGDKKDVTVKEAGDEEKKPDDKSAGDGCGGMKLSGDEIDAIAQKTAAIIMAAQTKAEPAKKEEVPAAGDELAMPLGGDSVNKEVHTSDDFIKDIWG